MQVPPLTGAMAAAAAARAASEHDQRVQEQSNQTRQREAAAHADNVAGVDASRGGAAADERDADGRLPHTPDDPGRQQPKPPPPPPPRRVALPKDPRGVRGTELDFLG